MRCRVLVVSLAVAACGAGPVTSAEPTGQQGAPIIGGTLDAGDLSVLELFYVASFPALACNGDANCLQSCILSNGSACTSGSGCLCGSSATCTGELVGPHTVLTAGHCTDLTAGGEISRFGPALTICQSSVDVRALASGRSTSNGCNLDVFVLFNNKCTTNNLQESCETGLINAGSYAVGEQVANPGYNGNALPPYTATSNDHDIGLVRLASSTLQNGGVEPPVLLFNRIDLGAVCSDLGPLKFVGYGIIDPDAGMSALSGIKYTVQHDVRVKDAWHNEEDGAQASPVSTCGAGTGLEPTCSGDSGGPSFNSDGVIVGVTSLGDNCMSYGEDTRVDAYQQWIDVTMSGWGDPLNGSPSVVDSGASTTDSGTRIEGGGATARDASVGTVVRDASAADGASPAGQVADSGGDQEASQSPKKGSAGGGGCGCSTSPSQGGGRIAWVLAAGAGVAMRRRPRRAV